MSKIITYNCKSEIVENNLFADLKAKNTLKSYKLSSHSQSYSKSRKPRKTAIIPSQKQISKVATSVAAAVVNASSPLFFINTALSNSPQQLHKKRFSHKFKAEIMEPYWSEANGHAPHSVKYESEATVSSFPYCTESSLNFSTSATAYSEDDTEYATGRRNKTSRQDPLSHRIIEKRRRDRMNSCLADLSRLIPPQYQRKGRGRIEKTEIIEMAIRHLKHLQNECILKENEYRMGYMDCMKETAKFLYDSQLQDCLLARLLTRLQEHCEEVLKNDCYKSRGCLAPDNVSGSSGSPHQAFHAAAPLCQLRDMLGGAASASDIEHSNDHNDVKDLSFRNHLNQLQRAVAASAAAAAAAAHTPNNHNNNNNNNNSSNNHVNNTASNVKMTGNNKNNNANDNNKISEMRLMASPTQSAATIENTATSTTSNSSLPADGINNINQSVLCQQQQQQSQQPQQQKPHQTPVITSTVAQHTANSQNVHAAHAHHNVDTSSQDFESSREQSFVHASDTSSNMHECNSNMHSPPPPADAFIPHAHQHSQNAHSQPLPAHLNNHHSQLSQHSNASDSALSLRLRNYSESSSHEIEHNNNYKYKNHIKERFNHELEEHEDEECSRGDLLHSDHSHGGHALSEHSKDGTEPEIAPIIAKKRKLAEAAEAAANAGLSIDDASDATCHAHTPPQNVGSIMPHPLLSGHHVQEENKILSFGDIKAELNSPTSNSGSKHLLTTYGSGAANVAPQISLPARSSFAVPIFALHGQGTYYVPLNVDYNALLPYLNGIDLLEKNYAGHMPVVHPININVNFMTPAAAMTTSVTTTAAAATSTTCTSSFLAVAVATQAEKHSQNLSISVPITTISSTAVNGPAAKAKIETAFSNGW